MNFNMPAHLIVHESVNCEDQHTPLPSTLPEPNLHQAAALLLLKLKESYKLTQSALQGVIEGTTSLWQQHLDCIHSVVNQVLTEVGVNLASVPGLEVIFDPEGKFGHPFSGLETQHRQMKYYKQHLGLVVSHTHLAFSHVTHPWWFRLAQI